MSSRRTKIVQASIEREIDLAPKINAQLAFVRVLGRTLIWKATLTVKSKKLPGSGVCGKTREGRNYSAMESLCLWSGLVEGNHILPG